MAWRLAISWMGVRPPSRWSARSSIAWIAYSPFAEICTLRLSSHGFGHGKVRCAAAATAQLAPVRALKGSLRRGGHGSARTTTLQLACGVAGEVGDHHVRPRAADASQRFHHRPLLIEPAQATRGADHRVLARDRVRGERDAELRLRPRDDVEVRQRGLDHDDVGPLVEIERDLAHRLHAVRGIHLVRAPVAELRCRVRRIAEGAVKARRVLRRVRHDRRVRKAGVVERLADRTDAAVHHVGGGDHVCARFGMRDGDAREQLERRVVADGAPLDDAAVPVARVLAQAYVGEDQQVRHHVLHRPCRLLHDAVLRVRLRAARVFLGGQTEQQHTGDPHARDVLHILHELVDGETELAGHRPDRLAHAAPVDDEQRVDEVINGQGGLADQLAEQRLLAETSRTEHRMRHHSLLRDRRPTFLGAREKYSATARARAGIVYSLGITSVGSPYSAAVAAVIGPMDATAILPRHALRSSSLNCSAKFLAVDELVNVSASTAPEPSASRRRTTPSSMRRVWYAGTSVTATPSRRSSTTSTSRASFALGSSTRSPGPTTRRNRSTSASARYSVGTSSTRTPCSTSASAVAGPIAATRLRAIAAHGTPRATRRRSTIATPFTLVKITQVKDSSAARAVSSGSHEAGGSMTIVGACKTRAPAASRSSANRCAWARARVTTMVRPSSGRSAVARFIRAIASPA